MNDEKKPNRVWIELERSGTDEQMSERAQLLSAMLRKLGVTREQPVFWSPEKQMFCFEIDDAGSFVEAADFGHWYNLDFFGKE